MQVDRRRAIGALAGCALASCMQKTQSGDAPEKMKKQSFGAMPDGSAVDLYTLTNSQGMEVAITNYGGIVVSLKLPSLPAYPRTWCWASIRWTAI